MSIYSTWRNIRQKDKYKNNKLKIMTPTWSDDSEVPSRFYSVSDIQGYTEYIIKKQETLPGNLPLHVYINRINNRLAFKLKDQ